MRSYGQRCALARALDIIGDRWSLLIVRELLIRGPCRYTDLQHGLPGIATNLLAERLRELEGAGIVIREDLPPPAATAAIRLTSRGEALETAILELGRWGAPLLQEARRTDRMLAHWIVLPLRLHLRDGRPSDPPRTIAIRADEEDITIEAARGFVSVRLGRGERADVTVAGSSATILEFLLGRMDLASARRSGLHFDGDTEAIKRLIPQQQSRGRRPTRGSDPETAP